MAPWSRVRQFEGLPTPRSNPFPRRPRPRPRRPRGETRTRCRGGPTNDTLTSPHRPRPLGSRPSPRPRDFPPATAAAPSLAPPLSPRPPPPDSSHTCTSHVTVQCHARSALSSRTRRAETAKVHSAFVNYCECTRGEPLHPPPLCPVTLIRRVSDFLSRYHLTATSQRRNLNSSLEPPSFLPSLSFRSLRTASKAILLLCRENLTFLAPLPRSSPPPTFKTLFFLNFFLCEY
jgi:hypothetical protein